MSKRKKAVKILGRPVPGEIRELTSAEAEHSGLSRIDLVQASWSLGLLKIRKGGKIGSLRRWKLMSDDGAAPLIQKLEEYWQQFDS